MNREGGGGILDAETFGKRDQEWRNVRRKMWRLVV
jgi:hypothetical protein